MAAEMDGLTVEPLFATPIGTQNAFVTNDGHVIASESQADGRIVLSWDGVAARPVDTLMPLRDGTPGVFASLDSNHVAIVGLRDGKVIVWRDGREEGPWDDFSRSVPPVFGGAGRRLAYGARPPGGRMRLILDGEPIGSPDLELAPIEAALSPDGERLAFAEMRSSGRRDTEFRIVLDGQPGEWFAGLRNAIGALQFGPDGRRFAHYVVDGKGHARWFLDGFGGQWFDDDAGLSLERIRGVGVVDKPLIAAFSPDGRRFAYAAPKGGMVAFVEDDSAGPLFKAVSLPAYSSDARRVGYVARTERKTMALLIDGDLVGEWPGSGCGRLAFSPDGARSAVPMEREEGGLFGKHRLAFGVVDGRPSTAAPAVDYSILPVWSPSGTHAAWWIQQTADSDGLLVIDGEVQADAWSVDSDMRFDADDRIVYCGGRGAQRTVVVGGEPGPLAEATVPQRTAADMFGREPWPTPPVPFRLVPGGPVAWAGVFGDRQHPVLGQQVGPAFDRVFGCRVDPDAVRWWAMRDGLVYQVARALASAPSRVLA